jgi:glycyl-tRNA synthetase
MSTQNFHNIAQLRFWNEDELDHRDMAQSRIVQTVKSNLTRINPAWVFRRMEGPQLTPRDFLSAEYTDEDIWTTPNTMAEQQIVLRPETTASTYAFVRQNFSHKKLKLPACFWQVGKSYRREKTATAAKLRFFEFTQLEMQCLYSIDTKADYRARLLPDLADTISWLTRSPARIVESDRLPDYSRSTMDIEVKFKGKEWREMASISIRTDFDADILNLEVAVGMDRIVEAWSAHPSAT